MCSLYFEKYKCVKLNKIILGNVNTFHSNKNDTRPTPEQTKNNLYPNGNTIVGLEPFVSGVSSVTGV